MGGWVSCFTYENFLVSVTEADVAFISLQIFSRDQSPQKFFSKSTYVCLQKIEQSTPSGNEKVENEQIQ